MSDEPEKDPSLQRVAAADREALTRLYEEYSEMVYAVAYRITQSSADAADVLQDVFVGLPEAVRSFDGEGSFGGWLKVVATRTALMRLRKRATRRRSEKTLFSLPYFLNRDESPPVVRRVALENALAQLPENYRTVIYLRDGQGMTHAEIGETLGITTGNARVRYHRAIRKLRELLCVEEDP